MRNVSLIMLFLLSTFCFSQEVIDNSQTPTEALEMGLPSLEKEWASEDYKNFNLYLEKISPKSYPNLSSENSREIFQKLISSMEQDILNNKNISINIKFKYTLDFQQNILNIFYKYLNTYDEGYKYSTELCYLQGSLLDSATQIVLMTEEFLKTLDKSNPDYQTRLQGLKQMKNGLATTLNGIFLSLRDIKSYSDGDRLILAKYFKKNSPVVLNFLDSTIKREFELKIEKLISEESSDDIKEVLNDLLLKL